ncbi:MAG: CopD family protein, partial [Methylocystis sp.]|nr:CopD family protein [Methylocystis sp.]
MGLATLRFLESAPAALAVGLLFLPRLIGEDGARFKPAVAILALVRAVFGFFLIAAIARNIIAEPKPIDFSTLVEFTFGTVVGKAWVATQVLALMFAALAALRLFLNSLWLDRAALWSGVSVIAAVSVTGHAIDDSLPVYTQVGFLIHTAAGLTWFGGLLGLVWWMLTARGKPPEVARRLAERWSRIAKIAMAVVLFSGLALAWENVASFPNLLATPYGRLLTLKLAFLCAVLLLALALARYLTRDPGPGFRLEWYAKVGAAEAAFGVALLFIAGWIAVITPASHENDLYWPLPFRISYKATWGYKVPMWSDVWWWGVAGLTLLIGAAAAWWTPRIRGWRRIATPAAALASLVCLTVSLSVQAYPDTFNDPTEDYTAESILRGYDLFQASCVACHGPMGEANGPLAKDLKTPPADLTAPHVGTHTIGDIFHWLTFGGSTGVMPP